MPTGPGDEILDAIEAGTDDKAVMSKYKIDATQLKAFKSLHYGLSNQQMAYDEIEDYYPEINKYFKLGPYLPKQQATQAQPAIEKPDFTKPVKQKQATESTAAPVALKDFQHAAESGKAGETLQQKFDKGAKQSLLTLNKELAENDDVVSHMIRQGRYNQANEQGLTNFAGAPRTDMPAASMLAGVRNRVLEPEVKPQDLPVAQEEVLQKKTEIQGDEQQARDFINKVALNKPEKAKELMKAAYQLDAYERLKQNPESGLKVNKMLDAIENREIKYNAVTRQLVRELGFVDALVSGVKERTRQMNKYELFQQSDDVVTKMLENHLANYDPDEPAEVPEGAAEIGQMLGMEWKSILRGSAAGLISSAVGGEAVAPYVAAAVNGPEYYQRGYATGLEETYGQARRQGKSPEEAMKIAREQAKTEGLLGAAEGVVSSAIGSRIGLRKLPTYNITGGFKKAVGNLLAKSAHYAGETTLDGLVDGLVAGYMQDRKDEAAADKGIYRDSEKNVRDNIMGELVFALGVGAMTKAGKTMVDPKTYQKISHWFAKQDTKAVNEKVGEMVLDGQLSTEDADNIFADLIPLKKIYDKIPDDIQEVSRMAMAEKIQQRQKLESRLENTDEALHPEIKEKIKSLNEEILEHSKHKKTTEAETEPQTQAEAEGISVEPEPEVIAQEAPNTETAQQTSPVEEGAAGITVEAEAAPAGELRYTNPEGTEYVLRGDRLSYINKKGEEVPFSDKAMETKNVKQLVETIKNTSQQPEQAPTIVNEEADLGEVAPELEQVKQTFSKGATKVAAKIRSAKRGGKEAFGGFLGLGVAIYDGMLETAATAIEAGGTIADAIQAAYDYVRSNTSEHSDDIINKAVRDELLGKYVLIDEDQEKAIEKMIMKAPASIADDKLIDNITKVSGLPTTVVAEMVSNIRKPQVATEQLTHTTALTPESRRVSMAKFDKLLEDQPSKEPSWWQRQWEGIKNASAWTDNPYRFITKIVEDINKHYGLSNKEAIPLGRQFEKSAAGRAALKIDSFIDEIIRGNIGGKKFGRLKGKAYKDFQKYLAAKRVIDRLNKQEEKQLAGEDVSRQTGNITRQDAQVVLEELENYYGNLDDFAARAKAMHAHMDTMLKNLVASGILSQESYDAIKKDNDFYAPFSVVQSKLYAMQDKQPVGISGVVKRIKGIDYKLPTTQGEALTMVNALGDALNEKIITPEEYFNVSLQILNDAKEAGLITETEYDSHVAALENPGFKIKDILDAAANMIYKSEGMALKNRMLQRLYAYKASDPQGLYIQDVDGFTPMTLPDGSTRMVPKPLSSIKVEPGMAPIKLRVGGKDVIVAVNKHAADKLTTMSNYETATSLKIADWVNKVFRAAVITLSPGFQVVNFAIDFIRTSMLSRYGPLAGKGLVQPVVNAALFVPQYIEALMHSAAGNLGFKSDTYKQWMESDSFSKGMFDNLFDNEKRIKEVNAPFAKRVLMDFLKLKFIEVPGSILEQTHKLATHQRGMSVEGIKPEMFTAMLASIINRNLNPNMSQQALSEALDRLNYEVQNFAGSPNFPQTHRWMKLTSIFLQFFSARVKGEMTDYRRVANLFTGKGEGVKFSKQEVMQIAGQFLGVTGAIAAYAMLNNAGDDDEKEFDGIPPFHQDNYLNIPLGYFDWEDENGEHHTLRDYAKVPLRGLTATMNVMANSFVKFYKRHNPEEFKKMALAFIGNSSPINLHGKDERELGESLASNLTPVFKYFIEYSFNRDTHNHRDIIPDYVSGKGMLSKYRDAAKIGFTGDFKPWDVATKKTPEWAKTLSKYIYENLGIAVSPIELDHMENTMGNPTELYDNALKKRLLRSESKYPLYVPRDINQNTSSATVTPVTQ